MEITMQNEYGQIVRFSPARDIAHIYPAILERLQNVLQFQLTEEDLKQLKPYTPEDLPAAFKAFVQFVKYSLDPDIETPYAAAERAGIFEVPKRVYNFVMEKLSISIMATFWAGIRSSVMSDECPPMLETLKKCSDQFHADMLATRQPKFENSAAEAKSSTE